MTSCTVTSQVHPWSWRRTCWWCSRTLSQTGWSHSRANLARWLSASETISLVSQTSQSCSSLTSLWRIMWHTITSSTVRAPSHPSFFVTPHLPPVHAYIQSSAIYPSVSQQYDFIFSFMPTFFFLVYFTLSHMTLLSHGSHVQSHDRSPDWSHDKGTCSVTWPWTIFTSHMSRYDSLLCVSSILSLWLTLLNPWLQWMFQTIHRTYWLILPHHPYSMMSLTMCTLLFLVHSQ